MSEDGSDDLPIATSPRPRRLCRYDLPSLELRPIPTACQELTLQHFEDLLERGLDQAEAALGYSLTNPVVDYKLKADVVWTNARRPFRPLETFLGIAEDHETPHAVWNDLFTLHCWVGQTSEKAAQSGGTTETGVLCPCPCPYPQPVWRRRVTSTSSTTGCSGPTSAVVSAKASGERYIQWIDLSGCGGNSTVLFPSNRDVLYMLRSILGADHASSPWSTDSAIDSSSSSPQTVILVVHPRQLSDEKSRLEKFRVSDASPSWALHAVVPKWAPPQGDDSCPAVQSTGVVSLFIYRRLPPRDCLGRVHPVTREVVPEKSCLWETFLPKASPENEEDADNSVPMEPIHRLVAPPYVDPCIYYPKEIKFLRENLESIKTEAALIAHWTAWPEQQHYLASSEDSADGGAPWNVFPLCYCFPANDVSQRHWIPTTNALVPNTSRILRALGNTLRTALFSRLDAGARLEAHTGWADLANHVLRLHVPLDIPPGHLCGTWVDGAVMTHQNGPDEPWICFDDSKTHRAFNYAAQSRTVLILDLERPSSFPQGTASGGHSEELDAFISQMSSPR